MKRPDILPSPYFGLATEPSMVAGLVYSSPILTPHKQAQSEVTLRGKQRRDLKVFCQAPTKFLNGGSRCIVISRHVSGGRQLCSVRSRSPPSGVLAVSAIKPTFGSAPGAGPSVSYTR